MEYSGSIVYSIWLAQMLPSSVITDKGKRSAWSAKGQSHFAVKGAITGPKGEWTHILIVLLGTRRLVIIF